MTQRLFGSGTMWGTATTDANGNLLTTPTPVIIGALQDVSIDISYDTKLLYGQNQFPIDAGRGKGKIMGKAKFANVNGLMLNSLVFGQTLTAGIAYDVYDNTGSAIPTTPFQITPTVPSSGTWAYDLGVRNGVTGNQLTKVASAPATGQYSVSAGVYTFAAADTGTTVFIDFAYTATSTVAQKSTVQSLPMGYAPYFSADIMIARNGQQFTLRLFRCLASKLTIATKQDDFTIPDFDFDAYANDSGQVFTFGTGV